MKTIRRDTNVHPNTITTYSTGTLTPLPGKTRRTSRDRRPTPTSATVLPNLIATANRIAAGHPDRIWIDTTTGDLWVLNHARDTKCRAAGCPHCAPKRRSA